MAIDPDAVRTQRPDGMAIHFFVNLAFFKSLYLSQKARSTRKTVDVNSEWRYHLLGLVQWLVLQHVLQKVIWIEGLITCMSYWVENKSLKKCDFSLKSTWKERSEGLYEPWSDKMYFSFLSSTTGCSRGTVVSWLQCARLRIKQFGFEPSPVTLCCVLLQDTLLSQCSSVMANFPVA